MRSIGKSTFREIKSSFGRFAAMLAIIALGVGFFAGLKVTRASMLTTVKGYLDKQAFYDFRLLSTLGFEEEDVAFFRAQEDVEAAEGSVALDVLYLTEEGRQGVVKAISLPAEVNAVRLVEGRLPQGSGECVVDSKMFGEPVIGSVLTLSDDNEQDTLDSFAQTSYTVVGLVQSPLYIQYERGNTALGAGRLNGFLYLAPEGFDTAYYTDVYVRFRQDNPLYGEGYDAYVEERESLWEERAAQAADRRYQSILREANEELEDARQELADKQSEGEAELAEAARELEDARAELDEGERALTDGKKEIADGKQALEDGRKELADGRRALEDGRQALAAQRQALAAQEQALEAGAAYMDPQALAAARAELAAAGQLLDAKERELSESEGTLAKGERELSDRERELAEGERELLEKEQELADAKRELADGEQEYQEARAEFEEKIAEARAELLDAEREVADIKAPRTYVLGRNTNVGYVCFENDSKIVEGVANVFPIFFFLVAALVCSTTMNRMVEEQRTQIGVLKALGYGNGAIMSKYVVYSGLAAVIGCVLGFVLGTWGFPKVIWFSYGIMYCTEPAVYVFDWKLALISLSVSLLCSVGTTWLSCRVELSEVAAQLMRPKAPKAGKRVLLERLPFLWKRMGFLRKVSVRNIFRYKKRLFMMALGISGCTALLVTGFGIKDSIADVADRQFREIQTYDVSVTFRNAAGEELETALSQLSATGLSDYLFVAETNVDIVTEKGTKSIYLVAGDGERMAAYVDVHTEDGRAIAYPGLGEGVITRKLAKQYGIKAGDTVSLRDGEMRLMTVKISAVMENYINNYVYVSEETWQQAFGSGPEKKTAYVNLREDADAHGLSAELMNLEETVSVTVNRDTVERVDAMMSSLDLIVLVVILCAAGLAFIVLYNLTNINITERIREIATIKVLGFYKKETASYVFRENLLLTAIGILLGLGLGRILHAFVMSRIQVDMIAFDTRVEPLSYLYSTLLTLAFTYLVNLGMGGKLENVSMTESLKSVD